MKRYFSVSGNQCVKNQSNKEIFASSIFAIKKCKKTQKMNKCKYFLFYVTFLFHCVRDCPEIFCTSIKSFSKFYSIRGDEEERCDVHSTCQGICDGRELNSRTCGRTACYLTKFVRH